MNEIETRREIERSIMEVSNQFIVAGNKAFYFRNESDIQCRLFARLSKNLGDVEIVHAEQRIEHSRSWHDLKKKQQSTGVIIIVNLLLQCLILLSQPLKSNIYTEV